MATLVLTTIGSIVGGPIGGAIGAVIGQGIDQRLLAPKGRQGPRLGDLTVQTSTYGSQIPKLFGTLRVAGTVIWATDLKETRDSSGGGKGRPKTINYSYSASFAVALSGRAITAIRRIWADGKLLRGAGDDWKSEIGAFRAYLGSEEQAFDPLVAAAEGAGGTPAYRGTAYALFEDLQLADFGNRIPSLTFEVEADAGPVALPTIASALSDGAVEGDIEAAVTGYAASGDSVRGAIEALAALAPLSLSDDGAVLRLTGGGALAVLDVDALGAVAGEKRARIEIERQAAGTLPDEVSVSYYEPARDYQAGLQRARRGGPGRRIDSVDLPAALAAGDAKAVAERRLARSWAERVRATVALPPRQLPLRPGGLVTLPGRAETFRIVTWTLEHMALQLGLTAVPTSAASSDASAGRPTVEVDAAAGTTVIALLDLPPLDDAATSTPRLWIAAAGTGLGWRRAQVLGSVDGGASFQALGTTRPSAIIGTALSALGAGESTLFDTTSVVEVELVNIELWLESRGDDALVNGANLAMLGDELIQFGSAEAIGPARFRLTRLLRGRRGSEWATAGHAPGDRFVMIDAATLLPFDVPIASLGGSASVLATGVGDVTAIAAEAVVGGRALRPPPPVHLSATRVADGTIQIGWVRRSRIGWNWLDGSDAPLGEETERYRLILAPDVGNARTVEVAVARYDYSPEEQVADGATAATAIDVAVIQLGALHRRSLRRSDIFRCEEPVSMTEASIRLALPLLQSGQAQKEVYHNEALARLDLIVAAAAQSIGDHDPPTAPDPGQCWIVGSSPTGAWAGQAGALAGWTAAGWRFVTAPEGALVWSIADGVWARRSAGGWSVGDLPASSLRIGGVQVVSSRQAAIANPSGGTTVDTEARTAITAVCTALRMHGLIAL